MKRVYFIILTILLLISFWFYNRNWRHFAELQYTFVAMGGIPVEVKGYDTSRGVFQRAALAVEARFEALEQEMSTYRETSLASEINRNAGIVPVAVADDTWQVLQSAKQVWTETGGAYDPTVRPLIRAWKAAAAVDRLPDAAILKDARRLTGLEKVVLKTENHTVFFRYPGMSIDLGGIAKGYFCDEGVAILKSYGIRRGLVNAGGDLVAYDDRPEPVPFEIGIQSPASDGLRRTITLDGGAVMTSGNYERYVTIQGERYSHIINPMTGWPANQCRSITVMGPSGVLADAYATAFAVYLSEGLPFEELIPEGYRVIDPVSGSTPRE